MTVQVTDNGAPALGDAETISITVNAVNDAPVLDPIGDKAGDEDTLITFDANATDPDGIDTLAYSLAAGAPAAAGINPTTGVFTWTPGEADSPGIYPVTVQVTDNGAPALGDAETISITVNAVNDAPVLDPIGDKAGNEATLISFDANATDPDGVDTLTYSLAAGAPAGASINAATGVFRWTPGEADSPGVHPVTVQVTDNGAPALGDAETISITVNEVNNAPVLDAIGDRTIDEETLLTFQVTASDIDSTNLTFSLLPGAPVSATIKPALGVFKWRPEEADGPGVYTVTIQVEDNGVPVLADAETIRIIVNKVNDAPVISDVVHLGAPGVVTFAQADFTGAFSDKDGDPLASIKIVTLPAGGQLQLSGTAVTAGQEIVAAAINQLTFTPDAANLSSSTLDWNASDGALYATNDALMTILVGGSRVFMPDIARD
ncbi:MAG: tandem-95 repeat protein [Anaerolineales bacterium]|nr:tandem-95 repeat protein [Anaerolineales bacterium]